MLFRSPIAYEIEHLRSHRERIWLREAIESRAFWVEGTPEEKRRQLVRLLRVEGLETFLKRTFLGAKQFSIEGLDTMILMLDEAVLLAARTQPGLPDRAVLLVAALPLLTPLLLRVLRRPWDPLLLSPVWMLCAMGLAVIARVQPRLQIGRAHV